MKRKLLAVTALAACIAPMLGQDESTPYFALHSDKTFAVGEPATIGLSATFVTTLDFRVYRVKDPVAFFQKLEDPHMFGGQATKPPREKTPLEKFHAAKVRWHDALQNMMRAQLSRSARNSFRDWRTGEKPQPSHQKNLTEFAGAPLLNPDQLVMTWKQTTQAGNRWDAQKVPVKVKEPGVYLVEAVNKDLRAYTILIVSDIAMVAKTMPGRLVAFVANRKTGEPQVGVPVAIWSDDLNTKTYETNSQGLADISLGKPKGDQWMVLARYNNHIAINTLYGESFDTAPERRSFAYLYTDRPVYRPGHTIHFKGLIRTETAKGYLVPEFRNVEAEIQDPDGNSVFKKSYSLSSNGAFDGDFALPSGSALGYFSLMVRMNGEERSTGFYVEDYKKPEYEVRVTPQAPRLVQGEPIKATIDARYYYGEPVTNAKVKYAVHRYHYWFPRYRDADADDQEMSDTANDYGGEQTDEKSATLGPDGKVDIEIPTSPSEDKVDMRYRVEARVTDAAGREIAGAGSVIMTYGAFMVNAAPDRYVTSAGEAATFRIETRNYDDQPVPASVHLDFYESRWDKKKGDVEMPVSSSLDTQTDAQGNARVQFNPPHPGSWHARATAKGPGPRPVYDTAYLWVTGTGDFWSSDSEDEKIEVVPDQKTYKPGDTAKVLIVTGLPKSKVLVSTESKDISSIRVVEANGPTVTIDVPIKPESVPNFYVSASLFHGGKYRFGQKLIRVPATDKQMNVQLSSPKSTYKPGEPAEITIDAKDSGGRPVAADFSVGIVDEAIYAIRPEIASDMLKFFYGHSQNYVTTDNSLQYYFTGEAGKRRMRLAQVRTTKLAQLKPERLVLPKIRKAFPDTILWTANVNTGSQGKTTVKFSFPDSLTAWRTTVHGITEDTKVGSATMRTIVRKDLIATLATPRFFTQGDEVTVSVIVRNYLTRDKMAKVSLEAKGLDIIGGSTRDINVPNHGEAKVDFRVRSQGAGDAVLTGKALTDEESDAVELTLPMNPRGVKMSTAKSGSLIDGTDTAEFEIPVPNQLINGSRHVEIRVAPSIAGAIFGALDYLTEFPYGCTEQTMSSFLPNVVVDRALLDLNIPSDVNNEQLRKKIKAGLERLYDYQHEDGGWGWWKTDDSTIFMTAYVVNGLAQAKAAGEDVNSDAIERGAMWLKRAVAREPDLLLDLRAYVLYSLALADLADTASVDIVAKHTDRLSPDGLALYGLALDTLKDDRAAAIAAQLEGKAHVEGDEASWQNRRDDLMDLYVDSSAETTAYAVKLLVHQKPTSPVVQKAVAWLLNHRRDGAWWSTTKQTAMVIYGLTDYLKQTGELKADLTATVNVNGDEKLSRAFKDKDAIRPINNAVRVDNPNGPVRIRVARKGTGRLYWSIHEDYYTSDPNVGNSGQSALALSREYFKLAPSKVGDRIVYQLNPLTGSVQQGDTLAVRLTVNGTDWRYVLLEDPIPSGTEFVERDDLYELSPKPDWWTQLFARREFHDDHAALFESWFTGKTRSYVYLLKVVNPGKFQISPARVQPMYQPDVFAISKAGYLEVQ